MTTNYNPADQQAGIAYAERVATERFASTGEQVNQTARMLMGCAFEAGAAHGRAVPAGWQLVPVEPTREMLVAINWPNDPAGYRAMLAAAPAAPVAQEPATWVSVADRLPSEDSEVIVSGWAYNDPARGRFVTHADFSDGQFKPVGAADEYDALHPPTHWMPMPAAPGEAAASGDAQPAAGHELFAELYQILGALGASEAVLDQVLAASQGEPLPHASLLPYAAEQPADTAMPGVLELLRERRELDGDARYLFGDDRVWAKKADAFLVSTAAEQPDTVAVPRELLAEAESIIDSYAEALKASHAPGGDWDGEEAAQDDYEREAGVAAKLRRLLAGGAE